MPSKRPLIVRRMMLPLMLQFRMFTGSALPVCPVQLFDERADSMTSDLRVLTRFNS
jgi:hypothetical protein